jgi:hypothetical protein
MNRVKVRFMRRFTVDAVCVALTFGAGLISSPAKAQTERAGVCGTHGQIPCVARDAPQAVHSVSVDAVIDIRDQGIGAEAGFAIRGSCYNCAEGFYYGVPAHWWHGTDGCDVEGEEDPSPGCKECSSEHCDDPSVPHYGGCPAAPCGEPDFAMEVLRTGNADRIASVLGEARVLITHASAGLALQVLDCRGNVALQLAVSEEEADHIRVLFELARLREDVAKRGTR